MLFDVNGIKLEMNDSNTYFKSPNIWKLNNTFLNNLWSKEKNNRKNLEIF